MKKRNILIFALILVLIAGAFFIALKGLKIGKFEIKNIRNQLKLGLDIKGGVVVVYEAEHTENMDAAIRQTINMLDRRINQLGLTEPVITKQGENRIRIELPGVANAKEALDVIGKTAQLELLLVKGNTMASTGMTKDMFESEVAVTGEAIADAGVSQNQYGNPAVGLKFTSQGAVDFEEATKKAMGRMGYNGQIAIVLDGEVISAPMVNVVITNGEAIIDGTFSYESANNLAMLIRGGALPVVLTEAYTSEVGPTLGLGAFNSAVLAGFVGIIAVMIFMIVLYRYPGVIAAIALTIYTLIMLYAMVGFGATLTLPGIAGMVISFGMAVDANVIIFERIKEELANQKSVRASVSAGFKRAMGTIFDSNITTIIAGIVLFYFGSGAIKGFAVTLMLGVAISMLTAVLFTHYLLKLSTAFVTDPKQYGVNQENIKEPKQRAILKPYKIYFAVSIAVVLIGVIVFGISRFNYGIDFTGGTMIQMNMHREVNRDEIAKEIADRNLSPQIVHAGSSNEQVIIKTTEKLDTEQRKEVFNIYKAKYGLEDGDLISSEHISGSVSKDIKVNAFWSVLIATVLMLVYITIRFEFLFGIGAVITLLHNVLVLLAIYAMFRLPVNQNLIAAVLTIVGYSINSTIVIYDRIREDLKRERGRDYMEIASRAVNKTLTRTINTGLTTLIVITCLYIFATEAIKEFALPLFMGIAVGTYSSVCLSSSLWALLRQRFNKASKYRGK